MVAAGAGALALERGLRPAASLPVRERVRDNERRAAALRGRIDSLWQQVQQDPRGAPDMLSSQICCELACLRVRLVDTPSPHRLRLAGGAFGPCTRRTRAWLREALAAEQCRAHALADVRMALVLRKATAYAQGAARRTELAQWPPSYADLRALPPMG
jgi:hypothetical protein